MNIRIIKNEAQHAEALGKLASLMNSCPPAGSEAEGDLELLALVIEDYERKMFPIEAPTPLEAIEFRMEQAGLNARDMVPYLGSPSKVSEVLNGKRALSLTMIRKLSEGLGIPAEVLLAV